MSANGFTKPIEMDTDEAGERWPVVSKDGSPYGFPGASFTVAYCDLNTPEFDAARSRYVGFQPESKVLPAGSSKEPGLRPLSCDVQFDRDVTVTMRDGCKLYADTFRPTGSDPVPVIIAWSPYGKNDTGDQCYARTGPWNCGIAPASLSGWHKFEGPDPAEWVPRGYAVVDIDSRGGFNSEGHIMRWGPQDARDVYDTIEWCTKQSWCSGAVTMAGNSWLAVSQINAAAREPHPALKCIAPWESHADHYRDVMVRGGIPQVGFGKWMQGSLVGRGKMEDTAKQAVQRPLFDDYWATKRIPVENIDIPIYQLASYSSFIHTHGSVRAFRGAKTPAKWLRIHNGQEWSDLYKPHNVEDLAKFYDFYLKGIDNGWESTPKVRLSLLSFTGKDVVERPEDEYPLARQQLVKYHLNASTRTAALGPVKAAATASYNSHHLTDCLDFVVTFDKYTEIAGYPVVKLFMSCAEHDDMDVRVQLRKMGADGQLLEHRNYDKLEGWYETEDAENVNIYKCLGATGMLRASHAVSYNEALSTEDEPFYDHDKREPVKPGTIVPLTIGFWPTGLLFEEGESLVLRVAGHSLVLPEFKILKLDEPNDSNKGVHTVHTGGDFDSFLLLPIIS